MALRMAGATAPDTASRDTVRLPFSVKVENVIHDVFKYAPLPAVSYSVETSWSFGLVKYNAFRLPSRRLPDSLVKNSMITLFGTYSLNRQYGFSVDLDLMHGSNRWNTLSRAGVSGFPSLFYGIGNDTRKEEGVLVDFKSWSFSGGTHYDLARGNFVGLQYSFSNYHKIKPIDSVPDETLYRNSEGISSGISFRYLYDSRDHRVRTHRGLYLLAAFGVEAPFLGSDFSNRSLSFDLRGFLPLGGGVTLGGQLRTTRKWGNVPIQSLAAVGGNSLMRGYYSRRFREKSSLAAQAEVRFPLFWIVSGAAYGAFGQVASSYGKMRWDAFHYAGGAGIRIEFDKISHSVARFDVSFSQEGHTYFLGFGEAF